ncbi:hypothetical protein T492DRAFT_975685 [Pavlovales sp. CCMP2436]|nr:hypothetical protein T492DRAFT_975685 [Pavlovales sp. CCMP2436]
MAITRPLLLLLAALGTAVAGDQNQMDPEFIDRWGQKMHNTDKNNAEAFVAVPCYPMAHYLRAVPHVNFFSLDVETAELEVIHTMDFTVTAVDLMMIEWGAENETRTWKIRRTLGNAGFWECPGVVYASAVFLHRRRNDLVEACCKPADGTPQSKQCMSDAAHARAALAATEQVPRSSWVFGLAVVVIGVSAAACFAFGVSKGEARAGY